MTIDLYPDIIRQEDLSPDEGFGGEIDEDCEVSQKRRAQLGGCGCSRFFFLFPFESKRMTRATNSMRFPFFRFVFMCILLISFFFHCILVYSRVHQGLGGQRPERHWCVGVEGYGGTLETFQAIRRALRQETVGLDEKRILGWFWTGNGVFGHASRRSRMLHAQKGDRWHRMLDQNRVLYVNTRTAFQEFG